MTKRTNFLSFSANVNGIDVHFTCWTTSTRCGFCHTVACYSHDITDTKVSYYNRTWESFTYETALRRAISKLPKSLQAGATSQIIDKTETETRERAEAFTAAFSRLHSSLSDDNKKRLENSGIEINTEADASAVMGLMACMAIAQ